MAEAVVSFVIERLSDLLLNEAKQGDKTLHNHVAEIREAAYDLENVIATFALKAASRSDGGRKFILKRFACILIDLRKVGSEVEKICARISKSRLSFQASGVLLQLRENGGASSSNERQRVGLRRTFLHNIDSDFVGFEENFKDLVAHLTKEGSPHKVVSICAMGGLGKTTLAGQIYFMVKSGVTLIV
ncbi:hypothetical protein TIFTF001_048807 [Ficus carica]|uniref:NB-ARC domain-containing protein n=1 Tax=Ficus carica TaxID=3494 RepID=A0AA87Z2Y2_FICCA|nr:hypothetical protein TIFTF001_048807 [Ficus carica]